MTPAQLRVATDDPPDVRAPVEREAVRNRLLGSDVVLPQLVDVWLASWELEAEHRGLDIGTRDYWDIGFRWIVSKCLRPD